ncbi:MotA/TolQ/ExbB proton channel family protein [Haloferula rosea]|uniref:MotA/TolQ/ExbB proton channel family protein n=1 Tax=Haloferula rosea TaxID=490093 RepID=A0A934RC15_9BACT|nr:MotA/TolQ/ExbB proton channel family protein [Haloferula rosea]MBK1827888.1 MotA/TolQ/ExbB proton channel family protein [Haloferula rosea]
MLVSCPHCSTGLDVAPEHAGQTLQCPACQGRLTLSSEDLAQESAASNHPEREGWAEKDHANPNFIKGLLIGIGITVAFLALMFPFKSTRVGAIFLERGWVNFAETFLFFWGLTILGMKWKMNQRQERAALLDLFPQRLGRQIDRTTVSGFIDNIYQVPLSLRDSLIVNRIRKALELFEARPNNTEVATFLSTQSELDANRSMGSYSLLKVFLWAIPILGFIGTVMGLSTAVGSLAVGDNSDPEALMASVNNLTGGLGLAFDTTLLGLILSILMSFPMAAVQKKEDETLTIIDAFCNEKVLPKLNDSKHAGTDELLEKAESIPQLVKSLAQAHETFLVNLNESTIQLKESGQALRSGLDEHRKTVETSFTDAVKKLTDTSSEIFIRSDQELNRTFEKIATGIDVMNQSLRDLGEKQIPNDAKRKRGLFRR